MQPFLWFLLFVFGMIPYCGCVAWLLASNLLAMMMSLLSSTVVVELQAVHGNIVQLCGTLIPAPHLQRRLESCLVAVLHIWRCATSLHKLPQQKPM